MSESYDLKRFTIEQQRSFDRALAEIKRGKKQTHWMWYIFPQLQGLGHSTMAMYYEIQSKAEAIDYWNEPILRSHMVVICQELLKLEGSIDWIMGYPDNLKLRSSMTLFWLVTNEPIFKAVLDKFYCGELDDYTVQKMS